MWIHKSKGFLRNDKVRAPLRSALCGPKPFEIVSNIKKKVTCPVCRRIMVQKPAPMPLVKIRARRSAFYRGLNIPVPAPTIPTKKNQMPGTWDDHGLFLGFC